MIKQDIIKAREELAAKEALDRGYRFAQIVEREREVLRSRR